MPKLRTWQLWIDESMNQKISFTKSNKPLLSAVFLLVVMLGVTSFATETFTALPDFQGSGKAIIVDVLLIPVNLGVIFILYTSFRLPKHIELNETASSLFFDGIKVNNPVEMLINSNKQNEVRYSFNVTSQGQLKLNTGFLYKIESDSGSPSSFDADHRRILLTDK